jgi:guanine deaminase
VSDPLKRLLRGWVIDPLPDREDVAEHEDGAVLIEAGVIRAAGPHEAVAPLAEGATVEDWRGCLLVPGFVDPHIHFPQAQATAVYAEALLDWLERGAFPEEARFADPAHAAAMAPRFLDTLLAHGTTTACAFCSSHPASAEALLAEAARRGMRMVAGPVMMDRNAPEALLDTARSAHDATASLIARFHGRDRLSVAISPRFAITSSPAQLEAAGALAAAHPDCPVQTHLSENHAEIAYVARLFPEARDYADVYARFGLLGPRSLMGHCIHLSDREVAAMAEAGATAVWCPTSNMFLGSGLLDHARLQAAGVRVAVGTDIGGGTHWGLPATLNAAYKTAQLRGNRLAPRAALRMATHVNACALGLGHRIGRLATGFEADVIALNPRATDAMRLRAERADSVDDLLFLLQTMGDDRAVAATWIGGRAA